VRNHLHHPVDHKKDARPPQRPGAVDLDACGTRWLPGSLCRCSPRCAVCGYGPHVVLHGPVFGALPGTRPWHHEYVPGEGAADGKMTGYDWEKHPRPTDEGETR